VLDGTGDDGEVDMSGAPGEDGNDTWPEEAPDAVLAASSSGWNVFSNMDVHMTSRFMAAISNNLMVFGV